MTTSNSTLSRRRLGVPVGGAALAVSAGRRPPVLLI